MESVEQTYRALTGIDIEEQKRLWDARGKGYYGEYLVFSEIYQNVIGDAKILMNLQVPTPDGKITEIDLLLLHESGIYIFEMKHYKGTIYGDDNGKIWTQYFRTVKNQHFNNPIHQNQYHVEAIKEMFPSLPVQSCIVFTNPECELRVTVNSKDVKVCSIRALKMLFSSFEGRPKVLSRDEIDVLFGILMTYSPASCTDVEVHGQVLPLASYLSHIVQIHSSTVIQCHEACEMAKRKMEEEKENYKARWKRWVIVGAVVGGLFCACCLAFAFLMFLSALASNMPG